MMRGVGGWLAAICALLALPLRADVALPSGLEHDRRSAPQQIYREGEKTWFAKRSGQVSAMAATGAWW